MKRFQEAEAMQADNDYPLLYELRGFGYCELLLADAEREAWRRVLGLSPIEQSPSDANAAIFEQCGEVEERAAQTLRFFEESEHAFPLATGLDHLSLGRIALYRALLETSATELAESFVEPARTEVAAAVNDLRAAGQLDELPRGLLTRAWLRLVDGNLDSARSDLDEAWEIAARGPMRLHMADIHLVRARLFRDKTELAKARELIEKCGYHRRDEELADAEAAAMHWPTTAADGG